MDSHHPCKSFPKDLYKIDDGRPELVELTEKLSTYFLELRDTSCMDKKHQRERECECMKGITDEMIPKLVKFVIRFKAMSMEAQTAMIVEWLRHAAMLKRLVREGGLVFLLPVMDLSCNVFICRFALRAILNISAYKWGVAYACFKGDTDVPLHKMNGKKGKESSRQINPLIVHENTRLEIFFEDLKEFCEPFATRVVRETTGVGLRDQEDTVIELPTSYTKRSLYKRFCFDNGWIATANHKGKYTYSERDDDDSDNEEPLEKHPTWGYFHKYWTTNYPTIRIRSPGNDLCGECIIYRNKWKYKGYKNGTMSDDSDDTIDDDNTQREEQNREDVERNENDILQQAEVFENIKKHVYRARAQRELVNMNIRKAKQDRLVNKNKGERTYTIICDYAQNLELPKLGSEQAGETYYYSPLGIYVFGIVDCSFEKDRLNAYTYHEGVGNKGGDNVASLLLNYLSGEGLAANFNTNSKQNKDVTAKELNICMDNCGGQNKNRMVLRLALFLVEMKYFKTVNMIFLIRGHTKNAADRLFNLLKKEYHKKNIYTFDQLLETLNTQEDCNVHEVFPSDFMKVDNYLNKFYSNFKPGTIRTNHIFTCTDEFNKKLSIRASNLNEDEATVYNFDKNVDNRMTTMNETIFEEIIPPGIKPIKQQELYKKWRPLIPPKYRDVLCKKPSPEVLKEFEENKKKRAARKKNDKVDVTEK